MKKTTYVCNLCGVEYPEVKVTAFEILNEGSNGRFLKLYKTKEKIQESDNHICTRCIGNIVVFVQKKENNKKGL